MQFCEPIRWMRDQGNAATRAMATPRIPRRVIGRAIDPVYEAADVVATLIDHDVNDLTDPRSD